ncbi:tether containing UBX domain for GLUT4-like protein, putative [Medicago truncatula]|uniref:Tether containing UBX domain for GLUT4-like protein, putative n=1 Tax=Medicago truncatula TaxID=3880 RepID=G7JLC9_MEDTR|nr:tether containing UBX domain for GLUT4-like protein, putative [Medicago truncatula]
MDLTVKEDETNEFYELTDKDYYKLLAVFRVCFPDNHTLEATFNPSETIQSLVDLLNKVILILLHTITPKKKLIKDVSQDFYTAGFCPGAIVYFSYDVSKGDSSHDGPYLLEGVMSLKGLDGCCSMLMIKVVPLELATQRSLASERD